MAMPSHNESNCCPARCSRWTKDPYIRLYRGCWCRAGSRVSGRSRIRTGACVSIRSRGQAANSSRTSWRDSSARTRPFRPCCEVHLMRWLREFWFVVNRRRLERELEEEMRAHREAMAPEDRAGFGNLLRLREDARDEWDGPGSTPRLATFATRFGPFADRRFLCVRHSRPGVGDWPEHGALQRRIPPVCAPVAFSGFGAPLSIVISCLRRTLRLAWMPDLRFWQESSKSFDSLPVPAGACWSEAVTIRTGSHTRRCLRISFARSASAQFLDGTSSKRKT